MRATAPGKNYLEGLDADMYAHMFLNSYMECFQKDEDIHGLEYAIKSEARGIPA